MNEQEFEIKDKHMFSFAAILFLAPLVPFLIKNGEYDITESEMEFINSYIYYGFIIDGILIICFLFYILVSHNIIQYLIWGLSTIAIGMIGVGVVYIFMDKKIFSKTKDLNIKSIKGGNINILLSYIPILNFYMRHNNKYDIKSYRWLKESVILVYIWIILSFLSVSISVNITLLFLYIIRTATLLGGIDFLPDKQKENIDSIYDTNPEEIFAYIIGPIYYFIGGNAKDKNKSINQYISSFKKTYGAFFNFKQSKKNQTAMIVQYLLLIILIFLEYYRLLRYSKFSAIWLINFLPILFLLGRYYSTIIQKKLPPIPILHEISSFFVKLF